ncbi:unnamed protein product [Dracunculus medinensis]|uniref:Small GTP-binding protein n=1 Tax=Dracunculus medinensis TaxID=318479 RepID=A0A0N4U9B4_DRAME|nr:unnamed protein product [Dracunculus medinensis]
MSHKIVVLGSSGVGKTSFINLICSRSASIPCSTVGCAVSVIAHQYRAGSAEEQTELIELWDIGGSLMHQKASSVFLEGATGAILVHDLSNSKSELSLVQWLTLIRGDNSLASNLVCSPSIIRPLLSDIENTPIPTLIVGCKLDLAPGRAKQSGYDRINVDCHREMPAGSTNRIVISRFFDSVVERKKKPISVGRRRLFL